MADGIVGSDGHHNKLPVCHLLRAKSRRGQKREGQRYTYIHTYIHTFSWKIIVNDFQYLYLPVIKTHGDGEEGRLAHGLVDTCTSGSSHL